MHANKAYQLLKDIGFTRTGGSQEELKAANIIIDYLKEIGVEAHLESFKVQTADITKAELEVLEPYQKKYNCNAYAGCAVTSEDGQIFDVDYLESDHEVSLKRANGKAVIFDGYVGMFGYEKIKKANAAAFIGANGDLTHEDNDLNHPELRSYLIKDNYNVPGVHVVAQDLLEMVNLGASKVRITVNQTTSQTDSHNVVAEIKGEDDEVIICTAHYDSVEHSTGVYDNGTGSVALYLLAKHFIQNKPRHTIRFVWCGSEERGLLGSKAYVAQHADILDNIKLNINVDMIGSIMGRRIAVSTAEQSFVDYISYLGKEVGYPIHSSQGVASTDSTPFADKGIPAVAFTTGAGNNYGPYHNRWDTLALLSEKKLMEDCNFVITLADRMANAVIIPVPRTMPENMVKDLNRYLGKEDKK